MKHDKCKIKPGYCQEIDAKRIWGICMKKEEIKQLKPKSDPEFYADTMELPKKREAFDDFNLQKGVFENAGFKGLNNDCGVFNRSAIFHTNTRE